MNEKNFNSISQFEVPKSWIDSALDVPASHTKKPFPFIKITRTLATVACFILVCGISVALYFLTDDSSIPPVKSPDSIQSQFVDYSNNTGESSNNSVQDNENNSDSSNTKLPQSPTSSGTHHEIDEDKTENGTGSHPEPNEKPQKPTTNETEKPDSTQPPTDIDSPSEPQFPTEGSKPPYDPYPPYEPTVEPTEGYPSPTEKPTIKPRPTEDPTEDPTEPPTECPTMTPPWVSPTQKPTIPSGPSYDNLDVYALIGANRVAAAKTIYCAVYDSNGYLLGDSNLYSSSHLAYKGETSDGKTRVYYYPYRHFDITVSGVYTYVFYNEKGEEMWRNTCYLAANI